MAIDVSLKFWMGLLLGALVVGYFICGKEKEEKEKEEVAEQTEAIFKE